MRNRPVYILILLLALTATQGLAQDTAKAAGINQALKRELTRMGEEDQKHRAEMTASMMKMSTASGAPEVLPKEVEALWDKQAEIDRANRKRLEEILREHGWPGKSLVGEEGATAAFLILQHSPLEIQKRYFPLVKEAAAKGEARPAHAAMLEDRILMYEGKKQIYGTQLRKVEGRMELHPVEDEEHVDARRAAVGLGPLAEYLKGFGLEYQPPKKQ